MKQPEQLWSELEGVIGGLVLERKAFRDELTLLVEREKIVAVLGKLKELRFNFLTDLSGVDYLGYPEPPRARFAVVYHLLAHSTGDRLRLKVPVDEKDAHVPSAIGIYRAALWQEREVFDMFGILFDGHPDLRRILTPEGFEAYPLRKDYPVQGRGERNRFPRIPR